MNRKVKKSKKILEQLRLYEPRSVSGQPPVVWEKAEGVYVYDVEGRKYLDWSSGVLVANAGHGRREISDAIIETVSRPLLFSYCFPTEIRAELLHEMQDILIRSDDKIFFLSTGSEATECAIKLAKTYALQRHGNEKQYIVSFENGFHGRTMGAQLAGGNSALKGWLNGISAPFLQVPFPDGFRCRDKSFGLFMSSLKKHSVKPEQIAGVIMESYQGGGASFAPVKYVRQLSAWCRKHDIVLVMDEVQSGFGRTGKWFAFEHYGIKPDLICCGKGISSSLPLSAVIGKKELMDLYPPGSMTSTHGGNPVCCAAALANLKILKDENIVGNARKVGLYLGKHLKELADGIFFIAAVHGKGLVYALHVVKRDGITPDAELSGRIVKTCNEKGLLFFAPVGFGGANIKICPPLTITKDEIRKGLDILSCAVKKEIRKR